VRDSKTLVDAPIFGSIAVSAFAREAVVGLSGGSIPVDAPDFV